MKAKTLQAFLSKKIDELAYLALFIKNDNYVNEKFSFAFDEIDRISEIVKKEIWNVKLIKAFEVYLGEAMIHWGGGEWTYYESKSLSMTHYNKRFGITKIESGEYKGYVPDFVPSWIIENRILSSKVAKPVSDAINSKASGSKKRIES